MEELSLTIIQDLHEIDDDIRKHLIDGYKNDKYTHQDIMYLFLDFRSDEDMSDVVREVAAEMYNKNKPAKDIAKFICMWNKIAHKYFQIYPVQLFVHVTDDKWLIEFVSLLYDYGSTYVLYEILTNALDVSVERLREVIGYFRSITNLLDLYIEECPFVNQPANKEFNKIIVYNIIQVLNIDLKTLQSKYRVVTNYINKLKEENV